MGFADLLKGVGLGDVASKVEEMISQPSDVIDIKDLWDSTPSVFTQK